MQTKNLSFNQVKQSDWIFNIILNECDHPVHTVIYLYKMVAGLPHTSGFGGYSVGVEFASFAHVSSSMLIGISKLSIMCDCAPRPHLVLRVPWERLQVPSDPVAQKIGWMNFPTL